MTVSFGKFLLDIVGDKYTFPFFEILFLLFVVYVVMKDWKFRRSSGGTVKRGKESWSYFYLTYGIASVIMMQIISVSDSLKNYKVVISVVNLGLLLYMCFFNGWFRNKIVGIISKSKEMKEGGKPFEDTHGMSESLSARVRHPDKKNHCPDRDRRSTRL